MVSYFLLRLLPTESTDPQSFVEDLKDLTITAYNLSNSDSFQGVQLGVAKRISTNYDVDLAIISGNQLQVDTLETSLLPHYQSLNPISPQSQDMYITQSAATAVIVINMTPNFEIPAAKSFDIRVVLERNSKRIGEATIENSISVTTVDKLPVKQSAYISVLASSTPHGSIPPLTPCVFVPPKPKISELDRPFVKLQSNGCNSVEKSGDVEERPLAPARLCAHCMVLTFEARWPDDVTEENNSFNLPYCRQDVYPGLPMLKASAESGCEFCGLLREVIESEVPGMRRSANKNLTEEMLSLDLNPKQFNITMDGIRCIVMENNGLLGLDHFYVGVSAVEAVDRDGDKPEDCGGLDMHFDVLAYPDDIAARQLKITRQPIGNYPLSSNNICLIKDWLRVCTEQHRSCRKLEPQKLPTRVVDIGDEGSDPHLVVTNGETGKYVAFSYQWGSPSTSAPPLKTTKANFQQYLARIPMTHLPKSFIDLIQVTRKLGERFIWVDALCIIQDDDQDWTKEVLRMRDVFRNSFITISATSINSSWESFLDSRNLWPRVMVPFVSKEEKHGTGGAGVFYIAPALMDKYQYSQKFVSDVGFTEWNTRGWTFQERELSRRTLYFGKTQLHYECAEGRWDEEEPLEHTSMPSLDNSECGDEESDSDMATENLSVEDIWMLWYHWVTEYSPRRFTFEEDRLPAIAGLAKLADDIMSKIGGGVQNTYVAGHWSGDLIRGLLWRRDNMKPWMKCLTTGPYLAPSWCWPSFRGGVEWRLQNRYLAGCKIVETKIENVDNNPMGRAVSGSIVVEGKLLRLPPPQTVRHGTVGRSDFHTERLIHHYHHKGAPSHLDLSYDGKRFGNAIFDEHVTMEDGIWYEVEPFRLSARGVDMFALLLAWEEYHERPPTRNAARVSTPHNPDAELHSQDQPVENHIGRSWNEPDRWPAGLLLAPTTCDAEGRPRYRRIGIFGKVLETDVDAATSVFECCESQTITII